MIAPELITLELARLVETSDPWATIFKRYDQLLDAGLSSDEAAILATRSEFARAPDSTRQEKAAA